MPQRQPLRNKHLNWGMPTPTLLGVTVLTSVDEATFECDFGTQRKLADQVDLLSQKLSQQAGLDGVCRLAVGDWIDSDRFAGTIL